MSINHAVLGLLVERPGYGYDLLQRLQARLGPAWQLNPSVVYRALDQLEVAQLVTAHRRGGDSGNAQTARRAGRVTYIPTDAGLVDFRAWLTTPGLRVEPVRAEIYLKVAFARAKDVSLVLEMIDHEERLTQRLCNECEAASKAGVSPCATPPVLAHAVHEAAVERLQSDLSWIAAARETLAALTPSS